jgi:hypothetical protein
VLERHQRGGLLTGRRHAGARGTRWDRARLQSFLRTVSHGRTILLWRGAYDSLFKPNKLIDASAYLGPGDGSQLERLQSFLRTVGHGRTILLWRGE